MTNENNMKLNKIIKMLLSKFETYEVTARLPNNEEMLFIVDPIDKRVVGSHYSLSHYCVVLLVLSSLWSNDLLYKKAIRLLNYILKTWKTFARQKDYHNDFNNFALSLIVLFETKIGKNLIDDNLRMEILKRLSETPDSNHNTVNWLAMRYINNSVRASTNFNEKSEKKANRILKSVLAAKNEDGFFDDILPIGKSANPQYHSATVAVLALSKLLHIPQADSFDLSDSVSILVSLIDPEGDFNYFGRGTNQVFGWGPSIFLLSLLQDETVITKSLDYLLLHLPKAMEKDNLVLNDQEGSLGAWWWDYHHVSVYYSYLLFWLTLTALFESSEKLFELPMSEKNYKDLDIRSTGNWFSVVFNGRNEYLCEKGPLVSNIWNLKKGCIFKGPLGPFFGLFGNKHANQMASIVNYFGVLNQSNRLSEENSLVSRVIFPDLITTKVSDEILSLKYIWKKPRKGNFVVNMPVFEKLSESLLFGIKANTFGLKFRRFGAFSGPYGEIAIFQSNVFSLLKSVEVVLR